MKLNYKAIEREVWNNCEHIWCRDSTCMRDDYPKYYCKKCKLWNDKRLYE